MDRFEFTEKYQLGLEDIDQQHARLFDIFNSLVEMENRGALSEEISLVLEELVNYIDVHFTYEEETLHQCVYNDLEEHRALHVKFVKKVIEFSHSFRHGDESISWEMLFFLRKWLIEHIMVEDVCYVEAVKKDRAAQGLAQKV